MKIALISDIHGNLEALTVALQSIARRRPDKIICLGDVVGYGADPAECLRLVRAEAAVQLLGNHDAAAVGLTELAYFNDYARSAAIWTSSVLSAVDQEFIRQLPLMVKQNGLHLVHATPRNPQQWDYIFSSYDARRQFSAVEGHTCFVGHSHVPGAYQERNPAAASKPKKIINIGSVGQPRDRDPRLCYVIYDTGSGVAEFVREPYDIETAAGKIRRAGLPEFLADRLFWGW